MQTIFTFIIFTIIILIGVNSALSDVNNSLELNSINHNENILEFSLNQNTFNENIKRDEHTKNSYKNLKISDLSIGYLLSSENLYFLNLESSSFENVNFYRKIANSRISKINFGITERQGLKMDWSTYFRLGYMKMHKFTLDCIENETYLIGKRSENCFSNSKSFYNIINPITYKSNMLTIDAGLIKTARYFNEKSVYRIGIQNKYINNEIDYNSLINGFGQELKIIYGKSSNWQEQSINFNLRKVYLIRNNLSIGLGIKTHQDINKYRNIGLRKNMQIESKISYRLSDKTYLSLGGNYRIYERDYFDMIKYNFFDNDNERYIYLNFGYINNPKELMLNNLDYNDDITDINKTLGIIFNKKNQSKDNIDYKDDILDINKNPDTSFDNKSLKNYALEIAKKRDKLNL